jgi:hypothetical protein
LFTDIAKPGVQVRRLFVVGNPYEDAANTTEGCIAVLASWCSRKKPEKLALPPFLRKISCGEIPSP